MWNMSNHCLSLLKIDFCQEVKSELYMKELKVHFFIRQKLILSV